MSWRLFVKSRFEKVLGEQVHDCPISHSPVAYTPLTSRVGNAVFQPPTHQFIRSPPPCIQSSTTALTHSLFARPQAVSLGHPEGVHRYYMIGDNPESDIKVSYRA